VDICLVIETTDLCPIPVMYTFDSHHLFLQPSSCGDGTGPDCLSFSPILLALPTSDSRCVECVALGRVPGNRYVLVHHIDIFEDSDTWALAQARSFVPFVSRSRWLWASSRRFTFENRFFRFSALSDFGELFSPSNQAFTLPS